MLSKSSSKNDFDKTSRKENEKKSHHIGEISKINNYLYFGSSEHSQTLTDEFMKLKIDVVIDLTGQANYIGPFNFQVHKFSFEDDSNATLLEEIDTVDELIFKLLGNQHKIYIQCPTGNSVSPSILIFYLMKHKEFTFDNALEALLKIRPGLEIHQIFMNELQTIDEWCHI